LTSSDRVISEVSLGLALIVPLLSDGKSVVETDGVTNYIPNDVK
jgi:hypothetical protein